MRSILKNIFILFGIVFSISYSGKAQLSGFQYTATIEISEHLGNNQLEYQVPVEINTANLIANGFMQPDGSDMRFAADCEGTQVLPYYFETGDVPSDTTIVWVRIPELLAFSVTEIYFFTGNSAATDARSESLTFTSDTTGGPAFLTPTSLILPGDTTFLIGTLNFSYFRIPAGVTVQVPFGQNLVINANRIEIEGTIDLIGQGNPGGIAGGGTGSGIGGGAGSNIPRDGAGGGAYGGDGGDGGDGGIFNTPNPGGNEFDDSIGTTIFAGSGGGGGITVTGGNGGGSVVLNGLVVEISGSILVDGNDGVGSAADSLGTGGGSGGGILVRARTLDIAGAVFTSNGGDGGSDLAAVDTFGAGGGGSGGRIKAIYYVRGDSTGWSSNVTANGGLGGTGGSVGVDGENGEDGTVTYVSRPDLNPLNFKVNPLINVQPVTVNGPDSSCVGLTETYIASVIPGNAYLWKILTGGSIVSDSSSNTVNVAWASAGSHIVRLITTNVILGCSDTTDYAVEVADASGITVDFDSSGFCAGSPTQFTNLSTGDIASYSWDFGDGNISATQHPVHVYATDGSYSVTLEVKSNFGCKASATEIIQIDAIPTAGFSADTVCLGALTSFNDLTSSVSSYSLSFDYGDGTTGAALSHIYPAAGTFLVKQTATTTFGCVDVFQATVVINSLPQPDFVFNPVCFGESLTIVDLSTGLDAGATGEIDGYNDGSFVVGGLPPGDTTILLQIIGVYEAKLTVTNGNGCVDSVIRNWTVYPRPLADFQAGSACEGEQMQFTNLTTVPTDPIFPMHPSTQNDFANEIQGVTYLWDFGDGSISFNANPSHTYANPGNYVVTLTATTLNGCIHDTSMMVTVHDNPVANFVVDPVCFGDSTRVIDLSTGVDAGATYAVDIYNDGSLVIPGLPPGDTAVLLSIVGVYETKLTITNSTGCEDFIIGNIIIYPQPVADFSAGNVCDGEDVQFTNNTTIPTEPLFPMHPSTQDNFANALQSLTYLWDFGDGNISNLINPAHQYSSPGTYSVTLSALSLNGCTDNTVISVTVHDGPVAQFIAENTCDGQAVIFTNTSNVLPAGNDSIYIWDFGDGTFDTVFTNSAVSHMYDTALTYTVTLTVITRDNCVTDYSESITIYPAPDAGLMANDVCFGEPLHFTNTTTVSNSVGLGVLSYDWDFGDGNTSTSINPVHVYSDPDTPAIYWITLTAISDKGCIDTDSQSIIVFPAPEPDFVNVPHPNCFEESLSFSNQTIIRFGGGVLGYSWEFGDGNTSTDISPRHQYAAIGTYTVKLEVTSFDGCVAEKTRDITIFPDPTADFITHNVCEDDSMIFANLSVISSGALSYSWDFGDGVGFSTVEEPVYLYDVAGDYRVTLAVESDFGCVDTMTRKVTVYPKPGFKAVTGNEVCFGDTIFFRSNDWVVQSVDIVSYFWDFGDGSVSVNPNPVHLYNQPGAFVVTLTLTSADGCRNSLTETVVVRDLPDAEIRPFGPVVICDGDELVLSAPTGNTAYLWSNDSTTQEITVTETGTYCVTVTLTYNTATCINTDCIDITVWSLPEASAGNDTTISLGYSVQLTASGGVSYEWFPTESLSNPFISNPVATPSETTTYTVIVTDENGCVDSAEVTITVIEDFLVEPFNLITPNQDGFNDRWEITNIETYPEAEVLIFDRWGTLVFSKKGYNNEWDGTHNGNDLPEGTYFYVIRFDRGEQIYKGAVSILR